MKVRSQSGRDGKFIYNGWNVIEERPYGPTSVIPIKRVRYVWQAMGRLFDVIKSDADYQNTQHGFENDDVCEKEADAIEKFYNANIQGRLGATGCGGEGFNHDDDDTTAAPADGKEYPPLAGSHHKPTPTDRWLPPQFGPTRLVP